MKREAGRPSDKTVVKREAGRPSDGTVVKKEAGLSPQRGTLCCLRLPKPASIRPNGEWHCDFTVI